MYGGSSGAREGNGEGHKARVVMAAAQFCNVLDEEGAGKSTPSREVLGHETSRSQDHAGSADAATVGTNYRSKGARWLQCRGVQATMQHVVSRGRQARAVQDDWHVWGSGKGDAVAGPSRSWR